MHPRLRAQILLSRRFIGRGAEYLIALEQLTAALRAAEEETTRRVETRTKSSAQISDGTG